MADCRGLIIAIEDYPAAAGQLVSPLAGATRAGQEFRAWLREAKKATDADIVFCASQVIAERTGAATIAGIKQALRGLLAKASEGTGQLYVFYSGHGASYAERLLDMPDALLLTQDFENGAGDCCIKLLELQSLLSTSLGPGEHFYFVDACRTPFSADQITPAGLGITPQPHKLGRPAVYTLYATARDQASPSDEKFWRGLSDGLAGRGKAKTWHAADMFVTFESLAEYLSEQRRLPVDADKRAVRQYRQVIRQVAPVPDYQCDIEVVGAKSDDEFQLTVLNAKLQPIASDRFRGGTHQFKQKPDDYHVQVKHSTATIRQLDPPPPRPADLYEDCRVRFQVGQSGANISADPRVTRGGPAPDAPPSLIRISVKGLSGARVELRNQQSGEVLKGSGDLSADVSPGTYEALMIEDGTPVRRERLVLAADAMTHYLDLGLRQRSPVREAIISALPPWAHTDRTVAFSEQLGHMASADLALWLSLLGASRILGPAQFSKLVDLPLMRFDHLLHDESGVYVLAGLERSAEVSVSVARSVAPSWTQPAAVQGMPGMFEAFVPGAPGDYLVSLTIDSGHSMTLPTCCLPNRVTLVVVAQPERGGLEIRQLMLPPDHLLAALPFIVQERLGHAELQVVKLISTSQALFARGESIGPAPSTPDGPDLWQSLLWGKWLDPMLAIVAGYALARDGRFQDAAIVVGNLREYFAGLPDTEALARLTGQPHQRPASPPLVLDGLLAFDDYQAMLPIPEGQLDFGGPWTMWRGNRA